MLIAVDGPAASGKGTVAKALAAHFGVPHLDTGALYRAVGLAALRAGVSFDDEARLGRLAAAVGPDMLGDPALRDAATADAASRVSALHAVREALLAYQHDFAAQPAGAVLDGRDIGTVIAPHAHAKLFVTAAPEIRANRRYLELQRAGRSVTEAGILADILARDARDSNRAEAPLRQADDADLLDTSELDIGAAVQRAVDLVSTRVNRIL